MRPATLLRFACLLLLPLPASGVAPAGPPVEAFDAGGLEARSAALILSGQQGGAIRIAALALPGPVEGDLAPVDVLVEIDGHSLLEAPAGGELGGEILTEVHAYALRQDGTLADFFTQAFRFDPAVAAGPSWTGVRFAGRLDLPPGEHSLRLLVLRRATDRFGLAVMPVTVPAEHGEEPVPDGPEGRWLRVRMAELDVPEGVFGRSAGLTVAMAAGSEPPELPVLPQLPERTRRLGPNEMAGLREAYLASLRHLAEGEVQRARDSLAGLEREKIEDGARERDLSRGQLAAAELLAERDPESLAPIVRLHLDLYLEHLERRSYLLATHSRRMMEVVLYLYTQRSTSADAGSIAAGALAGLGRRLLTAGNLPEARETFRRALEHQPTHAAAALGLAAIEETLGDYPAAVAVLRPWVEARPTGAPGEAGELREGWLRLAVNLARTGSTDEAFAIYRRLIEARTAGGQDWVAVVSHEELASGLAAAGRLAEAIELLGAAVERFPGEQRFYLQRAALLDRAGRVAEARQVLSVLDRRLTTASPEADSPRYVYSDWPAAAFDRSWRTFGEQVAERVPRLAQGLAAETGSSAGGRR